MTEATDETVREVEPGNVMTTELSAVYATELREIRRRRDRYDVTTRGLPSNAPVIPPTSAQGTIGLALSGGGIRSATLSLGVLQALSKLDQLRFFDYLSAVSGGGYIASCMTSLLSADKRAGVRPATQETDPFPLGFPGGDLERPEVLHLRDYSNYIAPQHGPFKLETWRIIAWYASALFLNLLAPAALVVAGLMLGFELSFRLLSTDDFLWKLHDLGLLSLERWKNLPSWLWLYPPTRWIALVIVAFWLIGAACLYFFGWTKHQRDRLNRALAYTTAALVLPTLLAAAPRTFDGMTRLGLRLQPVSDEALVAALGHVRLLSLPGRCPGLSRRGACALVDGGCPCVRGRFGQLREALSLAGLWMPRDGRSLRIIRDAIGTTHVRTSSLGPPARPVSLERSKFKGSLSDLLRGLRAADIGGTSWLGSVGNLLFGVLLALVPPAVLGYAKRSMPIFLGALGGLVGVLLVTTRLASWYDAAPTYWVPVAEGLLVVAFVTGFLPINRVSLLNFYRDRLADCYVIRRSASGDHPPIITNDPLPLAKILKGANGPYLLLNATMNLSGSKDLSLRGRMAAPFVFSKHYCGSSRHGAAVWRVGYHATTEYARGRIDLASAMAVSGAAVSPQSGSQTRPGLAVLLSLLNLRLGTWLPNPGRDQPPSIVWWQFYFMKELFSLADENDWYVNVSDGGHFDNTAIYSLLERRCRIIVAVDNGCDPKRAFQDMGALVRKARIDFGTDIEVDVASEEGKKQFDRFGFTYARIRYPAPEPAGLLVYIKPTLSSARMESLDIIDYGTSHEGFPQETTADQFFDESQFESYRELGYQIAKRALADVSLDPALL